MCEMRRIRCFARSIFAILLAISEQPLARAWIQGIAFVGRQYTSGHKGRGSKFTQLSKAHSDLAKSDVSTSSASSQQQDPLSVFDDFVEFLLRQQTSIIHEIESSIEKSSGQQFGRDCWGMFAEKGDVSGTPNAALTSGGITRVIQHGEAIEKGACSFTVLRNGILSAERAASIQSRQSNHDIQAGDMYSAVALSMVLHSRNPMVPTFRSDVRMFQVRSGNETITWLGGGADLTPYYLHRPDIASFHRLYSDLCTRHALDAPFSYAFMKQACDDYFYLPARQEHRGTGGIFFDDLPIDCGSAIHFAKEMTETWMPSWIPIVQQRNDLTYTEEQKHWQKLRRGRYLEFNLLYDRGVKFGLQTANPRVEGVMVSAPPEVAYEYNHVVEDESPEAELLQILRQPVEWI